MLRVAADGALDPFDAEVLSTFARAQGLELRQRSGSVAAVAKGEAELAVGQYADALATGLVATHEVFPSRLVAVTRSPASRAVAIEALRWSKVGALRGSRATLAVQESKISGAELTEYGTVAAALSGLRGGEVASLLLELPDALLARKEDPKLELGMFLGGRRSRVYASRPADKALLATLDEYLKSLRATASWPAILSRAFGSGTFEVISSARLID